MMRDNYDWRCSECGFPGHFCICFDDNPSADRQKAEFDD